ncbi:GNAT family N-acetyltransferase [Succinivibrio dextrinosolvens]|jgi:ribosomal protein S18 acetylase RimI-like enzyme|uniref:GNAT family N-acetyltransferase n=1 Tax=Succinivibrio dextrinosolvens TaxID=83771 RepID=UPI000689361A|nr:GNAT family N-acetyltransferase [Succinivibrio dextrinosolvens]
MEIIDGKSYLPQVKKMIEDSALNLNQDAAFQHFETELDNVEKKYLPPFGDLIVAVDENEFQGMAAYRKLNDERCEVKRLYVRREARGQHLGDLLLDELLKKAKNAGFTEVIVNTPMSVTTAVNLYKKHGFEVYEGEDVKPKPNTFYMIKDL